MSDSRERDDKRLSDEPNEAGFAGGATTPQAVPEDRGTQEAERIAIPGDDLTSAVSGAISGATERDRQDERSTEDR
ncbi:hypothetical protein RB614_16290 [Phytohabitans sp. ZYX-F-186]|uniref:Uncharacterized protein n=1 Tax=Phytohabitans maris TaxID=3071409 RepID=A0ABU0ZG87_9ACTN|nr:hypothetical protein [Phytohabitans sp. ZYX-F-186]MDQ7906073.1 hypothetical protein [Phytohabitans sp. ZYX-F-186]